ncbi:hypothetical protein SEA_NIOBE_9 [Arthrobacter phage Niobe]|uniref:Uncharacterized protein n=2 Tax=Yangvirus TaxID=2733221 RepID=A0A7G8LGY8_9CAUD|nr:hypothetical protein PQE13_gp09 [Arthrobacter phage Elezi]QNJ56510.1 hypothetical protein SEA_ELEZI_9 [Arthrobacter phage Elezi]QOP64312.1 hypothetical protein SEA_LONDON_9 [Arthrobacter phage London]UAJ15371.1 hypothetical protein SEA_ASA16_9 [Arthrobacter phage Asa16]WNN93965.1 hypothetical protein SEA_NITRO_9 [Arthrobacter phage Nitro]
MAEKADETYFVPAALDGVPVDPESDLFPLIAEEDLA